MSNRTIDDFGITTRRSPRGMAAKAGDASKLQRKGRKGRT